MIKRKKERNPGKESAKCFISCPLVMFCLSSKRSPGGYNWIYCPWNNKSCLKFYVFPLLPPPASKVGEERRRECRRGCLVKESRCNQWHHAPIIPLQQAKASSSPSTPEPSPTGPPSPGGSGPPNPSRPSLPRLPSLMRERVSRVTRGRAGVSGWVWLSVSQQHSG